VVLQISATTGDLAFAVPAKRGRSVLSRIKTSSRLWISPMTVDALPPLAADGPLVTADGLIQITKNE
jgi:hypothetical protein